jgi:chromosome segregation ATPase
MSPASQQNPLTGIARIVAVLAVVSLGVWGCARKPAGKESAAERVRALEGRCVKLEQDYRTVQQARDKARKELAALEAEVGRHQEEQGSRAALAKERDDLRNLLKRTQSEREGLRQSLAQRTSERDELQQQVSVRSSERDALQNRCERLRKGLQTLMIQDDTPSGAAPELPPSTTPTNVPTLGGQ